MSTSISAVRIRVRHNAERARRVPQLKLWKKSFLCLVANGTEIAHHCWYADMLWAGDGEASHVSLQLGSLSGLAFALLVTALWDGLLGYLLFKIMI
jgi:hypothetical protein